MTIAYQNQHATVHAGDCLDVLRAMPDESVHAVVTDPPYGLSNTTPAQVTECLREWATGNTTFVPAKRGGFMGKDWDSFVPPPAVWAECFRVLKPGGHLLAFAGSRTQDLMGMSVRMAGFDIRDNFAWLYGSGFPKSMDVSKSIDKFDASEERRARALEFTAFIRASGLSAAEIDELTGTNMGGHYTTAASQPAVATADLFDKLRPYLGEVPARIEELVRQRTVESQNFKARTVLGHREVPVGHSFAGATYGGDSSSTEYADTAAHTSEAQQWEGWGTALKPAFEPVVMARKPFKGTVAANVLEHGTGAINIDASRIGTEERVNGGMSSLGVMHDDDWKPKNVSRTVAGRFPANAILDESQASALDEQSSEASRFFYCAKAPKSERPNVDGTAHPTVKPLALMRYLIRMVTPPGGTILDPFAGSGTTLEAATLEGFTSVGVEAYAGYLPLIEHRLERTPEPEQPQLDLGEA